MRTKPEPRGHGSTSSSVWVFLGITFALSWPVLLVGFGWFDASEDVLKRYLCACAGMLMVAFSAFVTRALIERGGFGDVGWNLGRGRWYLVILGFCLVLWLGPVAAAQVVGRADWKGSLSQAELGVVLLSLSGFSVLAGFGEEFGWRGYLLPRLLSDRKLARGALLLVGLVWGVWHCALALAPLVRAGLEGQPAWLPMVGPTLARCGQMIASSVALSFIFGAVWLRSRSIFLASFLHGYWIGIRDAVSQLVSYPPVFRLVTLGIVLVGWYVADRWLRAYACGENAG